LAENTRRGDPLIRYTAHRRRATGPLSRPGVREPFSNAEFFRTLGEPELGALLICETDFDIATAGGGEVSFTRDQTIMQGASSCTFRYKFASPR
jgi:L-2-amino-thiazoline-4-carboxylic acid hydrolase